MTDVEELIALFDKHKDAFLQFKDIANPRSRRADLHAFLLLDELTPGKANMIADAEHDYIWLGVDVDELLAVITEDHVIELTRCGVMYDDDTDFLFMYA